MDHSQHMNHNVHHTMDPSMGHTGHDMTMSTMSDHGGMGHMMMSMAVR